SNAFGSVTCGFLLRGPFPPVSDATVNFINGLGNRVFDVDGTNAVPAGAGYRASLLVGAQSNSLVALPGNGVFGFVVPGKFSVPGIFSGNIKHVSFLPAGARAYGKVLVWDANVAATHDEAVALGAKHGAS